MLAIDTGGTLNTDDTCRTRPTFSFVLPPNAAAMNTDRNSATVR